MTRVMVVDDHPMWRDSVARDLTEAGHEVVATAADGGEAVRRAPAARPEVVVLDLQLPVMSGVEVTRSLVAADPSVRVLVLSASGEHADVLEAVKAGAGRAGAGGVPAAVGGAGGGRLRAGGAAADRARDRGAPAGGEGVVLQGHRRAAGDLSPHRAEPRPEHAEQAAAAQPG